MNRVSLTILGYLLFVYGFLSLILNFIGLDLWPLTLISKNGSPLFSFLIRMGLIFGGFIIFYMNRTGHNDEE